MKSCRRTFLLDEICARICDLTWILTSCCKLSHNINLQPCDLSSLIILGQIYQAVVFHWTEQVGTVSTRGDTVWLFFYCKNENAFSSKNRPSINGQKCTRLSQTSPQNGSGALVEGGRRERRSPLGSDGRLSVALSTTQPLLLFRVYCTISRHVTEPHCCPPSLNSFPPPLLPLAFFFCLLFPLPPRYAFSAPAPRLPAGCTVLRVDVSCGDDGACKRLKL